MRTSGEEAKPTWINEAIKRGMLSAPGFAIELSGAIALATYLDVMPSYKLAISLVFGAVITFLINLLIFKRGHSLPRLP